MEFRLPFNPRPIDVKIEHHHRILLVGSCFTEQMGEKLSDHKFRVLQNPHGILFNPISIVRSLETYLAPKLYTQQDLFQHGEIWGSWDHHTRFSDLTPEKAVEKINLSQQEAHGFLKQADWLLLTLGSAFVYELNNGSVVANCHKVPTDKFKKRLLSVEEMTDALNQMMELVRRINPKIKFIFTISPVRHLRDGFVENNRSKARLISAVHELVESTEVAYYFPAYELIIDDLRDYRFYAEDMVHPNYLATRYVWEKFRESCIAADAHQLMKDIFTLRLARQHRPFNPSSDQHADFLKKNLEVIRQFNSKYDYLDFSEEKAYFEQCLQNEKKS